MAMCIPVAEPDFWGQPAVSDLLRGILLFVSDDAWSFAFSANDAEERQLVLTGPDDELHGDPGGVLLFSGGADSLCAAIEETLAGEGRPVLVSHRSNPTTNARQKRLDQQLRMSLSNWAFPHVSLWANRKGGDAPEVTQRTRAFLFASLGAAVAAQLRLDRVLLADNGVVSLNLPMSGQVVGALASRSAHPKFIYLFNQLCRSVFERPISITNPLRMRTRSEVLEILRQFGQSHLLQETVSCAHWRGRPASRPHCGVCSQCVDRRFATLAMGWEHLDPPPGYGVDIFRDSLEAGTQRTMAESYVRFSRRIETVPPGSLFDEFAELFDAIEPDDADAPGTADAYESLLRRHSATTIQVLSDQIARASRDLARGTLPPNCLIRIATGDQEPSQTDSLRGGLLRHSDDYRTVVVRGQSFKLNERQAGIVRILDEGLRAGIPEMSNRTLLQQVGASSTRFHDVFKNLPNWRELIAPGSKIGFSRLNL
jgi:7-cyano-7-deazaguanine synthase in queuosine biosynthesis